MRPATASSFLINAQLMKGLAYDAWKDFTPLTLAASNPHLLVGHTGLGTPTFKEFLPLARQKGSSMTYASFGNGSSGHLAFELLKKTYDFPMTHVPYKGVPQAMTDVIGGQVNVMLTDLPPGAVQVKAGKMLGLAIAAEKRSPTVPDVGTFQELTGTRFVSRSWFGFLVRSGTPPEVVKTLQSEIVRALQNPGVQYDAARFTYIGRIASSNNIQLVWHTAKVQSFEDVLKTPMTTAGTGPANLAETVPKILNALVGAQFKVISGFSNYGQVVRQGAGRGDQTATTTFGDWRDVDGIKVAEAVARQMTQTDALIP